MLSNTRSSKGFTIVELVVTMMVIGVLLSIVTIVSIKLQQQSRDGEREGDVMAIMAALEKYYDKNGEYPANVDINTDASATKLPSFTTTKNLLPTLTDSDLNGPGGSQFYAACTNSACTNSSNNWRDYRAKQYVYMSRYNNALATNSYESTASHGNNTGWGCTITVYQSDPGFVMAWRREQDGIWIFKRSVHGKVEIGNFSGGPTSPQQCQFS